MWRLPRLPVTLPHAPVEPQLFGDRHNSQTTAAASSGRGQQEQPMGLSVAKGTQL